GLDPAACTLRGFSDGKREGLELTPALTAWVNADLRVGTLEETITVSGESPLGDVQTITHAITLPRETLDTLPTNKDISGFAAVTPAAVQSSGAMSVGGSANVPSTTIAMHGAKASDARVLLDGMRTTSMFGN